MQRILIAVLAFMLAMTNSAQAGWKLLDSNIPANVTRQIRVQFLDAAGKPVPVTNLSVRVDMSPDAMAGMTAPAKVSSSNGVVVVETNLYAPGRWALIISGTANGKPVKGTVVVTATQ